MNASILGKGQEGKFKVYLFFFFIDLSSLSGE